MHVGAQAEASPCNRGAIANVGFIVGSRCVAVIDTGGSPDVGRSLRAAVRKVTPLPVCYVVNTHVHPDHILGNAAFVADRPEFVGHAKLAAAMAARGRVYVAAAKRTLGPDAADAEIIPPTRAVTGSATLDLGDRGSSCGVADGTYRPRSDDIRRADRNAVAIGPAVHRAHPRGRRELAGWLRCSPT